MDMVLSLILTILLIMALIYLSGWFSSTETALTHLTPGQVVDMREKGVKNVKYIIQVERDMDRTLVAILIGNNVVNIVLSVVAALVANELFHSIGVTVTVGILTFLIIVFGEITPKSRAIINSERVASRNARAIYYLSKALSPLITMFSYISYRIIKARGGDVERQHLFVSDERIKAVATLGAQEGVIKHIERDIIHHVFKFGDRKVREIMVPMGDVFTVLHDMPVGKMRRLISKRGFTRVPVMKGDVIVGVVYSKDLLRNVIGNASTVMSEPFVVSADEDITETFESMKRAKKHMGVVCDTDGKHVGIVTLEDILEELVGEIWDEYFDDKYNRSMD